MRDEHKAVRITNGVCLTHYGDSDVVNAGFSRKWETRLKRALGLMDFAPRQARHEREHEHEHEHGQRADSAAESRHCRAFA